MSDQYKNKLTIHQIRHSAAHLTAAAVLRLYPETKLAIGPTIDEGFYYDLLTKEPIKEADIEIIEKEAQKLIG